MARKKRPTLADHEEDKAGTYCPEPEVIAAACLEIQKEWTEQERRQRIMSRPQHEYDAECQETMPQIIRCVLPRRRELTE